MGELIARVAEKSTDTEAALAVEKLTEDSTAKAADDVEAHLVFSQLDKRNQVSQGSLQAHQPPKAADDAAPVPLGNSEVHQPPKAADDAVPATAHNAEENTMAYKAFWSKFKRPSSTSLVEEEPKDAAPVIGDCAGASSAGVAKPVEPQELALETVEVPPSSPEFFVENQLGDPTLYPPSPSQPEVEVAETLKDSPHKVCLMDVVDGDGVPQTPNGGAASGPSAEVPPQTPLDKVHKFAPSHEDVKACLLRKTTMDLAVGSPSLSPSTPLPRPVAEVASAMKVNPKELGSMTSVVLTLAGVPQDCWVPLCREDAIAAGLVPSDLYKPPTEATLATPKSSEAPSVAPAPGTQQEASCGGDADTGKEKDESKALKNAYMRFHRSVTSILTAFEDVPMHDPSYPI